MAENMETLNTQNDNRSRYVGHTDLRKHFTDCKVNPGHDNLIPITRFTLDHLPLRYRDDDVLKLVLGLSYLTVMLKVSYTSMKRPNAVSCLSGQYPGYDMRGSDVLRTGTGFVIGVDIHSDTAAYGPCRCKNCVGKDQLKPSGEIIVLTARHVVFDESEAKLTRCVLDFDENNSTVVNLDEWRVEWADSESDRCALRYVTCDMDLLKRLDRAYKRFDDLFVIVCDRYKEFAEEDRLAVMVSHPHGCPKHVTVGQWEVKDIRGEYKRWMASVCPGTGGANVFRP
ncbi:uncharacterized protein LOC131950583 [Physella acuta]|uniref:uncharacterized protein LOC131950583 n=1 Tax=Physella acuta TaxID=109671 RepID=UPI0027DDC99E|nr:uncharacterized protein LOC131950583 [Physella acuta]XP_059168785.1 uncharacterized protein LOC131950583 [Physella acuta]XP_059168786.1 uncharacterized protein LOC131950583 [Physella acuta]XP_059168787.1 uncharacterized protein LOC131950583 [Physella acuta]